MNILLVSPIAPPVGGMATWTEHYLKKSKNINNIYLVNTALIGKRASQNAGYINVFNEIKRFFNIIKAYYSFINTNKIDVIHINSACSKTGIIRDAVCVGLANKHKIVFHCHCNVQDQLQGQIASILGKYIFNNVSAILVLNRKSQEFIKKQTKKKIFMLPNSIDIQSISANFQVSREIRNIIYVGHVKPEKGINEIIKTALIYKEMTFHIVGPIYMNLDELFLPNNLIFHGNKKHEVVIEMMNKADIFLFPSYTEGFSMVMLEAMAAGLPIIASDVGANSEMLESYGGLIIKPKSSEAIFQAIEYMKPRDVREKMSKWNLRKIKKYYNDDIIFRKTQEIYHEINIESN